MVRALNKKKNANKIYMIAPSTIYSVIPKNVNTLHVRFIRYLGAPPKFDITRGIVFHFSNPWSLQFNELSVDL
jgi:hypothetical protein